MILSIYFGILLLFVALLPVAQLSSPMKIWSISWGILWLLNGIWGGEYRHSDFIYTVVFFGNCLFIFGALTYEAIAQKRAKISRKVIDPCQNFRTFRFLLWSAAFAGWLALDFGLRQMGSGGVLSLLTSGDEIFTLIRENHAALYSGSEFSVPSGIKISTSAMSFLGILTGFLLASRIFNAGNTPIIFFTNFIIYSLALSAATGVRSLLLVGILFFFFSTLSYSLFLRRGREVIRLKFLLLTLLGVCAFFVWVFFVQSTRLGNLSLSTFNQTIDHMRPWFAGYLPALSVWFEDSYSSHNLGYGTSLFRALLGPTGLVSGEGFDLRVSTVQIGDGRTSNAMTMFRVLLSDFGLVGGVFFCYLWGLISHLVYHKAIRRGGTWIVLAAANGCAVFFSINYWFFAYGARFFGVIGVIIAFKIANAIAKRYERRCRVSPQVTSGGSRK